MPFINTLKVEPQPGSDSRKLLQDLVYVTPDHYAILVECGFMTDYASVPRLLWSLFPRDAGDTRRAGVLHDWLYSYHQGFTRAQVDKLFRVALAEEGASRFKRWSMWSAVRTFGRVYWYEV